MWCILNKRVLQGSVYAPSFDHGVGDPVEDDIFVSIQWVICSFHMNILLYTS